MRLHSAPYTGEKYVSEKVTHALAKKHELPDADDFHYYVNSLAHSYFQMKDSCENLVTQTKAVQKLNSISQTAKKLKRLLEELDPITDRAMWRAHWEVVRTDRAMRRDMSVGQTMIKKIHGNPKSHYRETEQSYIVDFIDDTTMLTSMDIISNYAEHGKTQLPAKQEGPIERISVDHLIANFRIFWHEDLGRKFTCDFHNGECITPAYLFCEDTALAIDPEIKKSQIRTYMRRRITVERERLRNPRYKIVLDLGSAY